MLTPRRNALLIVLCSAFGLAGLTRRAVHVDHYHDLGKLLFGFVIFWAYIAFSQFMLIWYGNIPEETIWFEHRWHGGWVGVSLVLFVGNFVFPFFLLLPRTVKRLAPLLAPIAVWLLVMHYVDIYWLVVPSAGEGHGFFHWSDILIAIGMGCLYFAALVWRLARVPVVPVGDPFLEESMKLDLH